MHDALRSCFFLTLLVAHPAQGQEPARKLVKETWDAAYIEGAKAGYFHTQVVEIERDGKKLFVTTQTMSLKVRREGNVVELKMDNGEEETSDGKVVGVVLTQYLGPAKLTVTGQVEGDNLVLRSNGRELKKLPWDAKVLGLYAQDRIWKEKKVKPGDQFEFVNFELAVEKAFKVKVVVKDKEETDVLEVTPGEPKPKAERVKRSLLRAEATPDKVDIGGALQQLPKLVTWLNADYEVLRAETEMPGLGRIVTYRTTKTVAMEEGTAPALLPDLLLTTLVPVNKPIERPLERAEVVYRITLSGDGDPMTAFARDTRQTVENVKGNVFDLRVKGRRTPLAVDKPEKVGDEFLKSNHFLDSDDSTVTALAARAIGTETDAWERARRIEKWVHDNMKSTASVVFATASQVARDRQGDCRQHAMLTAAMCRAAGVPSRTALGLVYTIDREKSPVLAFHMWTEVFVRNQWMGLDATLGLGGVTAAHVKIADHSWHDTQTLAPLLPVLRVLGKSKVDVVSVK